MDAGIIYLPNRPVVLAVMGSFWKATHRGATAELVRSAYRCLDLLSIPSTVSMNDATRDDRLPAGHGQLLLLLSGCLAFLYPRTSLYTRNQLPPSTFLTSSSEYPWTQVRQ